MNITNPLIRSALDRFCEFDFAYHDADQPRLTPDSPYFLNFRIQSDIDIDDHNRLMILQLDIDDDLPELHLIITYSPFDLDISQILICADTNITPIIKNP